MPHYQHGRHEHGQYFLIDQAVVRALVDQVANTQGPIVEIGPGDGALTLHLQQLQRPLTAVEIDPRLATRLSTRTNTSVQVVNADFLRYRLPRAPHILVGNLPFHQTTAILRHVLNAPRWTDAVLLVQWEVARRRAGVGGATLMTAQWSPWFSFELHGRVPAAAFRPRPGVDGGVLVLSRRTAPLLGTQHRTTFQSFAHRAFTGPGRGLADVLYRAGAFANTSDARRWLRTQRIAPNALPKNLSTLQWIDLFARLAPHHRAGGGRTADADSPFDDSWRSRKDRLTGRGRAVAGAVGGRSGRVGPTSARGPRRSRASPDAGHR